MNLWRWIFALLALALPIDGFSTDEMLTATEVPQYLRVAMFPAKCALPTDCGDSYVEQFAADIKRFQPDIVIATEFFWKKSSYRKLAEKIGLPYSTRGPSDGLGPTGGIVILSRFPFTGTRGRVFDSCVFPDCWVDKGTLYTRVLLGTHQGQDVELQVISFHFQAKSLFGWISAQNWQIREQSRFLKKMWVPNLMTIYGGDFNFTSRVPDWLCGSDSCREKIMSNWGRLFSSIVDPYQLQSVTSICELTDPLQGCLNRPFEEHNGAEGDVTKFFYHSGASASSHNLVLVPRRLEYVSTVSDHLGWVVDFELLPKP